MAHDFVQKNIKIFRKKWKECKLSWLRTEVHICLRGLFPCVSLKHWLLATGKLLLFGCIVLDSCSWTSGRVVMVKFGGKKFFKWKSHWNGNVWRKYKFWESFQKGGGEMNLYFLQLNIFLWLKLFYWKQRSTSCNHRSFSYNFLCTYL